MVRGPASRVLLHNDNNIMKVHFLTQNQIIPHILSKVF